jgi:ketosteroid isomerase-like protein
VAGVHPNELLARREIEFISQGDVEGLRRLYADDCVFHYPGKSPLAGTHRGVSAFMANLDAVFAGATITRELHDALGTDNHAVQLLRVTATAGARSHTWHAVWVMHVRDGQFCEAWAQFDDQYRLDDFLNALTGQGTNRPN